VPLRVVKEDNRTCDGCNCQRSVVHLIAIGGKTVRVCPGCWEDLFHLRRRVVTENLEAAERNY